MSLLREVDPEVWLSLGFLIAVIVWVGALRYFMARDHKREDERWQKLLDERTRPNGDDPHSGCG